MLLEKSEMLCEYFAVKFVDDGGCVRLTQLPRLLDGHAPSMVGLPEFVLALAWRVDWTSEMECFHTVSLAFAELYCQLDELTASQTIEYQCRHVLSPGFRTALTPPQQLLESKAVIPVRVRPLPSGYSV